MVVCRRGRFFLVKGRGPYDERQVGCPCCEQVGRMQVGASSCGKERTWCVFCIQKSKGASGDM